MKQLDGIIKRWWVAVLFGVLAIAISIYMLFNPLETYITFSYLFAAYFIVFGAYKAITVWTDRENIPGWGWSFTLALITLILGLVLLIPGMAPGTFLYYIAFGVMFMGINTCSTSFVLKEAGDSHWGWTLAFGILTILFSVLMIMAPLFSVGLISYFFAFMFLFYGIHLCYLGYRLSVLKGIFKREQKAHQAH